MNLIRCEKGHFYDKDKFASCPHCVSNEDGSDVTMALQVGTTDTLSPDADNSDVTMSVKKTTQTDLSLKDLIREQMNNTSGNNLLSDDDNEKTIYYSGKEAMAEPVVGWLIGLNGDAFGIGYKLTTGKNFIGRGNNMDVILSGDAAVSREKHAIVTYEPKSRTFFAQPGESKGLFYVNDNVVLNNVQLKKNDILLVGNTKLMLIPCCDEQFSWEDVQNDQ